MKLRDISDAIYEEDDRGKMEAMNSLYYEMADYIGTVNPSLYKDFCERAEGILYNISEEEAEMLVREMRPYGEHWTMDDVSNYVSSRGMEPSCEYYLAMNMAFNDYRNTAQMMGIDTPDFYFNIANDFINDVDGKSHKIEKYFREE